MRTGDKVRLRDNPRFVHEFVIEMLRGKEGVIVSADYMRDWVVEFPGTQRVGGQFALDEPDLVLV